MAHQPTEQRKSPAISLTLPTAKTARQHLGSKKKSETKQVHPGYSMFDWNKLCNSGRDMTGTGGKVLRVTPEELALHCTDNDLWTSVRGIVYNVTLFAKYHPGGKPQLMRGAGKDCTELFDKIHVWVNSETILEKCIIGVLVGTKAPKKASNLTVSIAKPPFSGSHDDQEGDVLSIPVPPPFSGNHDDQEGDVLSIPVPPPFSGGHGDQGDVLSIPVPPPYSGGRSDQEGDVLSISVPPPYSGGRSDQEGEVLSIPVPNEKHIHTNTNPNPTKENSVQKVSSDSVSSSESSRNTYMNRHPLISKTAYETSV